MMESLWGSHKKLPLFAGWGRLRTVVHDSRLRTEGSRISSRMGSLMKVSRHNVVNTKIEITNISDCLVRLERTRSRAITFNTYL